MSINHESKINFHNEDFIQNPFPVYEELRKKDPITRFLLPNGKYAWLITKYNDVIKVLKDPRFVSSLPKQHTLDLPPHMEILTQNLSTVSPEAHRRLRRLVQKAFTPKSVENLRGRIEVITNDLLDKLQDKNEMDLIEDFAFPLPIKIICELLGVPIEDQDKFRHWSDTIMKGFHNPELSQETDDALTEFIQYLQTLIKERQHDLQNDLVSDLIRVEHEGDKLSEKEMYAMIFSLIVAGHETTVNLISNGVLALLENPEQKEKLTSTPELIHSAIEEILRYNGPVEVTNNRWATEDVEMNGKTIKKGEMVFVSLSAANRDPEQFDNPESFNITREVNNHIAFGKGVHFCLGAHLARLEGEIAINTLLKRMPNLKLRESFEELEWRPGMIIRGLKQLPLSF